LTPEGRLEKVPHLTTEGSLLYKPFDVAALVAVVRKALGDAPDRQRPVFTDRPTPPTEVV
jgi:hypothetical protein